MENYEQFVRVTRDSSLNYIVGSNLEIHRILPAQRNRSTDRVSNLHRDSRDVLPFPIKILSLGLFRAIIQ